MGDYPSSPVLAPSTPTQTFKDDGNHVLFISIGHPGQTNPMLAIAHAYQSRNPYSRVTFATSNDLKSTIEGDGFGFVNAWPSAKLPDEVVAAMNSAGVRSVECMLKWALFTRKPEMYATPKAVLVEWMRQNKPSMVVCDSLSEAGMGAATDCDIPFIVNSPTPPYLFFPKCLPPFFPLTGTGTSMKPASLISSVYNFAVSFHYKLGLYKRIVPIIKEQEQSQGIPMPSEAAKYASLFINNTSHSFSDPRVAWPEGKVKFIGVSLQEEHERLADEAYFEKTWTRASQEERLQKGDSSLYSWIDEATTATSTKPLVLVALGTLYKLDSARVLAMYQALASLPVKVVWKMGAKDQEALLPREALTNPDFRFESWIPDLMLLLAHPSLKLFVNHAGGNSLHEGLYFAKPMVCLPGWMDCFDFGMGCQDLGAGVTIQTAPKLDRAQFRSAVYRVLFSEEAASFWINAKRVSQELRSLGGAQEAARLIEEKGHKQHGSPSMLKEKELEHEIAQLENTLLPPC